MKSISLKLPESLEAKLVALSKKRRTTVSAIIREAIEAYSGQEKNSLLDLAGDLCGCLSGPTDLATNPKHMAGYGT